MNYPIIKKVRNAMREKQYKYEITKQKLIELAAALPEGAPLPNRNKLALQCGVARITLERAISELIGEGILASYDGRGTYATGRTAPEKPADREARPQLDEHLWGMLVYSVTKGYTPAILRGVEDFARQHGINLIVCNTDNDPQREVEYLKMLYQRSVSGIVVIPSTHSAPSWEVFEAIRQKGISVVACSRQVPGYNFPGAFQNFFQSGFCATQHLLEMGCRKIAYLATSQYCTIEDKLQGYLAALDQHNAQHPGDMAVQVPGLRRITGDIAELFESFLRENPDIDGLFVFNDRLCMTLYQVCRRMGLTPGKDIRVVSGENSGFCEAFGVPLSSVDIPVNRMGALAAEQLLALRAGAPEEEQQHIVLGAELHPRASSLGFEG